MNLKEIYEKVQTPKQLLEFMSNHIQYGYLGKNEKVYKEEDPNFNKDWEENYILEETKDILLTGVGNCWDQVELERSWFLEHGYEIKTIYEMVNVPYENVYPTHTFLMFKDEKGYWNWFENADFKNRGIHTFPTIEELLYKQYQRYVSFFKMFSIREEEIPHIIMREYDCPKKNSKVHAFLAHVMNGRRIILDKEVKKMKRVVFATNNPSKAQRFSKGLLEKGIEVVSLRDLKINLQVDENGKDAIENARIKARACYKNTHMPTIGMDDTLYLENVPEDKQPGLFVRRVHGKTLSDEEMIEHYIHLVKQYGNNGKLNCKWIYGMVVIDEYGHESSYTWSKGNFYMVDVASSKLNPGYPLNSISKYKKINKYFTDITEEDKKLLQEDESDVVAFIVKSI